MVTFDSTVQTPRHFSCKPQGGEFNITEEENIKTKQVEKTWSLKSSNSEKYPK